VRHHAVAASFRFFFGVNRVSVSEIQISDFELWREKGIHFSSHPTNGIYGLGWLADTLHQTSVAADHTHKATKTNALKKTREWYLKERIYKGRKYIMIKTPQGVEACRCLKHYCGPRLYSRTSDLALTVQNGCISMAVHGQQRHRRP
jgi:hypothetical protein